MHLIQSVLVDLVPILCLCDDIDEIPSKILETIESFAISICNGKKYAHSYCSGELELLKMNERDL